MDIHTLKQNVQTLTQQKQDLYNQYLHISSLLQSKITQLKNLCPHTNKQRQYEEGCYGQKYYYCPDCQLELY